MEFHRRDGFSDDGAFEIDCGKSKNNANAIKVIESIDQRISEKNNDDVLGGITISLYTESKSIHERKLFCFDVDSQPPNKRAKNIDCSEFIQNKFHDLSNCNYTRMSEELGEPIPNWEERITVEFKEEEMQSTKLSNHMSEHFIEFLAEKGSEYDENCYFIGDESREERKSEAICLVPGFGSKCILKSSNWKTKLCHKWEINGWCRFGDKCLFAHGSSELRNYDGRLVNKEAENRSTLAAKQTTLPAAKASICRTGDGAHVPRVPRFNRLRLPSKMEVPTRRWKGPNKISKIYGDGIDDFP